MTFNNGKLLIVEDELLVAEDLERTLSQLGYQVVGQARTGRRAIQLAEQSQPDLVLMDILLHGSMDGIAAAEEIYNKWQIPAVFVTAHTDEELISRAKGAHFCGFVTKPLCVDGLHATIRIALHQIQFTRSPSPN